MSYPISANLSEQELRELVPRLQQMTEKYKRSELVQKALFDISELAGSVSDINALYPAVHKIISTLMDAQNFFVAFYDEPRDEIDFVYFVDQYDELLNRQEPAEKLKSGITGYVLRSGNHLFLTKENTQQVLSGLGVKAIGTAHVDWIGVPLKRGQQVIGAMVVQSYHDDIRYSEAELEVLLFVSQHIVSFLDRVKSRELTERTIRERTQQLRSANQELQDEILERQKVESLQQALFEISELAAAVDGQMSQFYECLHDILARLLNAPNCYVAMLNEAKDGLTFPYYSDEIEKYAEPRALKLGLTEFVLREGKAELVDQKNVQRLVDEGLLDADIGKSIVQKKNSWMGSPLVIEGKVCGVIVVQSYGDTAQYQLKDLELLRFVSHHIAVALERKRAAEAIQAYNQQLSEKVTERTEELHKTNQFLKKQIEERKEIELKLIHDAHHDALTDLPNRVMFTSRLELAIASKKRYPNNHFAVLFIDLDRFKLINDTLGHQAGDKFLIEVANRIQACIRGHDLLARMGGDEFVILLDNFDDLLDVEEVATRIITSISEPFDLDGKEMHSGASVGIAYIESGYQSANEIIRDADAAMYQAKSMGRGRYVMFDKSMRQKLLDELDLENEFRRNLKASQFECYVQPITDLADKSVLYFECYVRWHHPNLGKINREQFWQVAEHSGLTIEIDEYLLQQACSVLIKWQRAGGEVAQRRMAINLSINHLMQVELVDQLLEQIRSSGVDPTKLVFEFDENDLNRRAQLTLPPINKLKQAGVTLVLDNFGSGLASLSYLYNYPFDYVKVDHRFVRSLPQSQRNLKLIQSIILISQHLDFTLIASGVDEQEACDSLLQIGCQYGQGKYLQPAQSIGELTHLLSAQA